MDMTSNIFPVQWTRTLSRMRKADGEDVLDESRYTYLMFLIVYWLVEFPAFRIVLAYDYTTKTDMTTANHFGLAASHILVAIILLPLFVAVWTILVMYSILHWAATSIRNSRRKDAEEQPDRPEQQERRKSVADGEASRGPKKPEDSAEEKTRRDRKEKEDLERKEKGDRVRERVSLLINPPKLYENKLRHYNKKIKNLALMRKGKGEGESGGRASSAPSRPTAPHRLIWSSRQRGDEEAADDKVAT